MMALFAGACKSGTHQDVPDLDGKWEVYGAFRNGKQTETLNGAEFRFDDSGKLVTNVTGVFDSATYELIDRQILYHGTDETVYDLATFTGDSMELSVKLRGMYFLLQLQKLNGK